VGASGRGEVREPVHAGGLFLLLVKSRPLVAFT
jgi:hypothetical protein